MADLLDGLRVLLDGLTADERTLSGAAFRAIRAGRRLDAVALGCECGLGPARAAAGVATLAALGSLTVGDDGTITGSRGLSSSPTPHVLAFADRTLWAYCALDAVAIPLALGLAARVTSRCHGCAAPLELRLDGRALVDPPPGVTIWAAEHDAGRPLRAHT